MSGKAESVYQLSFAATSHLRGHCFDLFPQAGTVSSLNSFIIRGHLSTKVRGPLISYPRPYQMSHSRHRHHKCHSKLKIFILTLSSMQASLFLQPVQAVSLFIKYIQENTIILHPGVLSQCAICSTLRRHTQTQQRSRIPFLYSHDACHISHISVWWLWQKLCEASCAVAIDSNSLDSCNFRKETNCFFLTKWCA